MSNISQFISLFDKINIDQSSIILSLDIFKSYLYNKTIPVLNDTNTEEKFIQTFMDLSEYLEDLIFYFAETKSFLKGEFLQKLRQYLYGNISDILDKSFVKNNSKELRTVFAKGLKSSKSKLCESIKFMTLKYFNLTEESDNTNDDSISSILSGPESTFYEMNNAVQYVMKYWYQNVIELIINYFYDYKNKSSIYFIVFFISLIVVDILAYSILWRSYEEKLKLLLKGSIDLINLIPLEIKKIIIEKLNE
jgi:hypothetical protein